MKTLQTGMVLLLQGGRGDMEVRLGEVSEAVVVGIEATLNGKVLADTMTGIQSGRGCEVPPQCLESLVISFAVDRHTAPSFYPKVTCKFGSVVRGVSVFGVCCCIAILA